MQEKLTDYNNKRPGIYYSIRLLIYLDIKQGNIWNPLTCNLLNNTGSVLPPLCLAAFQNCFWAAYLFIGHIWNRQSEKKEELVIFRNKTQRKSRLPAWEEIKRFLLRAPLKRIYIYFLLRSSLRKQSKRVKIDDEMKAFPKFPPPFNSLNTLR